VIWRCYYVKHGGHVHCRLFCGPIEGALGKCGDLCFRDHEFTEFTGIRKVIAMDFRRELGPNDELAGDDDVQFARLS
jgi:hypothetical protein